MRNIAQHRSKWFGVQRSGFHKEFWIPLVLNLLERPSAGHGSRFRIVLLSIAFSAQRLFHLIGTSHSIMDNRVVEALNLAVFPNSDFFFF